MIKIEINKGIIENLEENLKKIEVAKIAYKILTNVIFHLKLNIYSKKKIYELVWNQNYLKNQENQSILEEMNKKNEIFISESFYNLENELKKFEKNLFSIIYIFNYKIY